MTPSVHVAVTSIYRGSRLPWRRRPRTVTLTIDATPLHLTVGDSVTLWQTPPAPPAPPPAPPQAPWPIPGDDYIERRSRR